MLPEPEIEETIKPYGMFRVCCITIKPATHVSCIIPIPLFKAFNTALTLDVLTCVIYSVFILIDEISRSDFDTITYLELAKTVVIIMHGLCSSMAYKQCMVLRNYSFAFTVRLVKSFSIAAILICLIL